MADDDDTAPLVTKLTQHPVNLLAIFVIQVAGWFVSQDDAWLVDQGSRNCYPLLFSGAQGSRFVIQAMIKPESCQERCEVGLLNLPIAYCNGYVVQNIQIGNEVEVLKYESELGIAKVALLVGRHCRNVCAFKQNATLVRLQHVPQGEHQGCLATSTWARDHHAFSLAKFQRHVTDCLL